MTDEKAIGLQDRVSQKERVLKILRDANGGWVDGMLFLRLAKPITQFHARMFTLQGEGHDIQGRFIKGKNWKEYRLIEEPVQGTIL